MAVPQVKYLDKLLSETCTTDVEIIQQKIKLLTDPGEHYGSIMLAIDLLINIEGVEKELNLAAKLIPTNAMLQAAFDIPVTFKKEAFAYKETIPALVAFQKEYNVPQDHWFDQFFPKCYGCRISLDESKGIVNGDAVILLENLKIQGYYTADRLVGHNLDASKVIISDLARIHAVPIALKKLKPDCFKKKVLPALLKNKNFECVPEVREVFQKSIIDGAKKVPDLKPYLGRLEKMIEYRSTHFYVDRQPPSDLFGTFSHTDYWTSNMMLLNDKNGKPIKNKMVDLQMMNYSSALRDLMFFMFTSVINSVLEDHFNEFLDLYYKTFIKTLQEFDLDVSEYTRSAFDEELNDIAHSEAYHILAMLKPICTERGKVTKDVSEFCDDDWKNDDCLGETHKKKLRDTVLALVKRNWL